MDTTVEQPPSLLILGGGAVVAECYVPALTRLGWQDQVVIVESSDRAASKIRGLCPTMQIRVGDFADIIQDRTFASRFRGVVIALPNRFHEQAVSLSLQVGLDVLCEKPLAHDAAACIRIASAADRCGRKVAVGMVRRLLPSVKVIRDAIQGGLLGEVQDIDIEHGGSFHWPSESGNYFQKEHGGIFLNMGIHYLDMIATWVGPLTPIEYSDDGQGGVEANCKIALRSEGAARVGIRLSHTHQLANRIRVRGTRGEINVDVDEFASARWHTYEAGLVGELRPTKAFSVNTLPSDFISSFAEQFVRFAAVIARKDEPSVTASQAALTHRVIDWGYSHRHPLFSATRVRGLVRPSFPSSRTVVTGGSGFLGCALIERLCELGFDDVVVPVRSHQSGANAARFPVSRVPVNLLDRQNVRETIAGARYIFHLAYGTTGNDASRVTVAGTKNIVDAAIELGAEVVVVVSTASVFGHPHTKKPIDETFPYLPALGEYGRSKAEAEKYALRAANSSGQTRIVVVNPAGIYGPNGRLFIEFPVRAAIAGQFAWVEEGIGNFNYTFVDNVVDALVLAANSAEAHGSNFIVNDGVCSFHEFFTRLLGSSAASLPSYSRAQLLDLERASRPSWRDLIRGVMNDEVMRVINGIPALSKPKKLIERRLPKIYERVQAGRVAIRDSDRVPVNGRVATIVPPSWLADVFGPIDFKYSSERARRVLGWRPLVSLDAGLARSLSWLSAMGIMTNADQNVRSGE